MDFYDSKTINTFVAVVEQQSIAATLPRLPDISANLYLSSVGTTAAPWS
ncbi:hypothetical protein [Bordetella sp. LUAb4]|nr:hypothetical protein [Bordetella sp. LUAb4]